MSAAKHVLILGGGFGGLTAAHNLRKGLGQEHRVTLVDKQPLFIMGLTKLWILNGTKQVGEAHGNRAELTHLGIDYVEGEVTGINPTTREVQIGNRRLNCDYLIIALGADYSTDSPKGFDRFAKNLYNESGCAEMRDILRTMKEGTATVLVCALPFKCPPAPYEASMIIDDVLRKNGVRESVNLQIVTPEAHPLGILGPEAGQMMIKLLTDRGIKYHPSQKVAEIKQTSITTDAGKEIAHNLLFAIPIHVAPHVLKASGLVDESGWVPVNPETLATRFANVFAVGDCAATKIPKGMLLPRAGVLAEAQGKVVANNIIVDIQGTGSPAKFEGIGVCYAEVGDHKAAEVSANFFTQPNPKWEFNQPSDEGFAKKRKFLEERIKTWFS